MAARFDKAAMFVEFLEVAIHAVLYNRGIYPAHSFRQIHFHNFPTRFSTHEGLIQYVKGITRSMLPLLQKSQQSKVVIAVLDPSADAAAGIPPTICERFVFDLAFGNSLEINQQQHRKVKEVFLAALAKLATCNQLLAAEQQVSPEDWSVNARRARTFTVLLYANEFDSRAQEVRLMDNQSWQRWLPAEVVAPDLPPKDSYEIHGLASAQLEQWWASDLRVEIPKPPQKLQQSQQQQQQQLV